MAILDELSQPSNTAVNLEITYVSFYSNTPGAKTLNKNTVKKKTA